MLGPALLGLGGFGLQIAGTQQRTDALKQAQAAYEQWLRTTNREQNQADKNMIQYNRQMGRSYDQSLGQLADQYQPDLLTGAYNTGEQNSRAGIEQVLAGLNRQDLLHANPIFQQTQARENNTNASLIAPKVADQAMLGGLNQLGQYQSQTNFDFAQKAAGLAQRAQQAQNLYQYGNAMRQKALARATGQNQLDQSAAMQKGNLAMLLGALMMGGSQVWGAYNAFPGEQEADPMATPDGWERVPTKTIQR